MNDNAQLIEAIQKRLRQLELPGWLFYGFRDLDPIALDILRFGRDSLSSRRWFYLVPAEGEPRKLVHRIEPWQLDHLPGSQSVYLEWQTLHDSLQKLLDGIPAVAMQYSENNAIPYISRVDAGIVEWIRSLGTRVVSSATLIQHFQAILSEKQRQQHREAALVLSRVVQETFHWAAGLLARDRQTDELQVQAFIVDQLTRAGLTSDHPPIVGVNQNSADCHYSPTPATNRELRKGDFLLVDLFGKAGQDPASVYADITWTALFGTERLEETRKIFEIVKRARNRGVEFLHERLSSGRPVEGWEVDDVVRKVIQDAGYGAFFVHRVGHSLGQEIHGNGVHFDNLETHDTRQIIPGLCCTIEPGIYLEDFGIRSEINILVLENDVEVTTPPQEELLVFPCP